MYIRGTRSVEISVERAQIVDDGRHPQVWGEADAAGTVAPDGQTFAWQGPITSMELQKLFNIKNINYYRKFYLLWILK